MDTKTEEKDELWRTSTRLPHSTVLEFGTLARELGMKRSHLLALCAVLGLRQIERALHPEKAISTEAWGKIAESMGITKEGIIDAIK